MPEGLPRIREKYVDAKAIPQIKELIAKYDPDILWFDTSGKLPFSENLRILEEIREVDADVVVNGRLARGHGRNFGDYINTGDRAEELSQAAATGRRSPRPTNRTAITGTTISHKPPQYFIRLLAKAVSRNGNMLLNVGPDGRRRDRPARCGDSRSDRRRGSRTNGESIYGCGLTPLPIQPWGTSTRKDNALYLHVFDWPTDRELIVGGLRSKPTSAELLTADGKVKLEFERRGDERFDHSPAGKCTVPRRQRHQATVLGRHGVRFGSIVGNVRHDEPAAHVRRRAQPRHGHRRR